MCIERLIEINIVHCEFDFLTEHTGGNIWLKNWKENRKLKVKKVSLYRERLKPRAHISVLVEGGW